MKLMETLPAKLREQMEYRLAEMADRKHPTMKKGRV